jgi:hypothetical protein
MTSGAGLVPLDGELPELAGVAWRTRVDERALTSVDRLWTRSTLGRTLPFVLIAIGMPLLSPLMIGVSVIALGFAWFIPSLYAARGAGVLQPPRLARGGVGVPDGAEDRALGLLGDLVGHDARAVLTATGFVVEPGTFGVWVVGPAGALLVRGGRGRRGRARRVQCYCVHATGDDLPRADRIAHLLLALRADEAGFATVANLAFSGAGWRVRRRLASDPPGRAALDAARALSRSRRAPAQGGRGAGAR